MQDVLDSPLGSGHESDLLDGFSENLGSLESLTETQHVNDACLHTMQTTALLTVTETGGYFEVISYWEADLPQMWEPPQTVDSVV